MAANVQVILSRDVPNLGHVGDVVGVRPGYARNYLLPKGLALPVSKKAVAHFEHQKKVVEHRLRLLRAESEKKAAELGGVQITLTARVGEQGKLFGSIGNRDIAKALKAEGVDIDHRDVKLDGPLKSVGLHEVAIRLEADVQAKVKVVVAAEEVPEDEKEEAAEGAMEAAAESDGAAGSDDAVAASSEVSDSAESEVAAAGSDETEAADADAADAEPAQDT
jgi:large subunit ribosomal protein L9